MRKLACWTFTIALMSVASVSAVADSSGSPAPSKAGLASAEAGRGLEYQAPEWPEPPDTKGMITRLITGTTTVLGLCVATLWIGKRWLRGAPNQGTNVGRLRVLETVRLGNRCSVVLLSVGRQEFLAGTDGSGLKSLISVPDSFDHSLADSQSTEMAEPIAHAVAERAVCETAA